VDLPATIPTHRICSLNHLPIISVIDLREDI
jgi:hypothetical protein